MFVVVARILAYGEPPISDEGVYAVIAREMLHGARLYLDVWDIKPPGIYLGYAAGELLAGYGPALMTVLSVALTLIILGAVYVAGRQSGGRTAGAFAAVIFALMSHDVLLEGTLPNADMFANAALAWGFVWVLQGRMLAPGIAFAAATFFKTPVVVVAGPLAAAIVAWPADSRRREVVRVAVWLAIGAAAWIGVFIWAAASGRLARFAATIFSYGRYYGGSPVATLTYPSTYLPLRLAPALVLTAGSLKVAEWDKRNWIQLLAYAVGVTLALIAQGRGSPHYFQLWLPIVSIGSGWAIWGLWHRGRAWAVIGVSCIVLWEVPQLALSPSARSRIALGSPRFVNSVMVARQINEMLAPQESFIQWGSEPQLYYLTGRRPPVGVFYLQVYTQGPLATQLAADLRRDVEAYRPELLVVNNDRPRQEPMWSFFTARYSLFRDSVGEDGMFSYWARRGGALERRLARQASVRANGSVFVDTLTRASMGRKESPASTSAAPAAD